MATDDFFRARLDGMVDPRHPRAVLARRLPWTEIEASLAPLFARTARMGKSRDDADMFGPTLADPPDGRAAVPQARLQRERRIPGRALERERGLAALQWHGVLPVQAALRRHPDRPEAGVEQLLKTTIEVAVTMKAVKPVELERVIVDSTVQEKAIAHPTDSCVLEVARAKLVQLAKRAGLKPKMTHEREAQTLRRRAGGYAHAKQFKRLRQVVRRQRTILGVLLREVQRKMTTLAQAAQDQLRPWLERAEQIRSQRPKDKNKVYALHAPEVECIGKGKARKPYEFGVKVSLAVAHKSGLIVGARSFPGNPFDGHTLAQQLEQTGTLLQDIGIKPKVTVVDMGYRGVDKEVAPVEVIHCGKYKSLSKEQKRWLKRRQAIEPTIGHTKHDHRMDKCWLKGSEGDALHAVLCTAGFNIRWLMRALWRQVQAGGLRHISLALIALCASWLLGVTVLLRGQMSRLPVGCRQFVS